MGGGGDVQAAAIHGMCCHLGGEPLLPSQLFCGLRAARGGRVSYQFCFSKNGEWALRGGFLLVASPSCRGVAVGKRNSP